MTLEQSELDLRQTTESARVVLASVPVVQGQGHDLIPATIDTRTLPARQRRLPIVMGTLGLLALLAVSRWYWWANDPVAGHYKTLPIERGPITALVTATGAVEDSVQEKLPLAFTSSQAAAVAFLFSLAVGIFFGLYPANKASRMNSIEALHYE